MTTGAPAPKPAPETDAAATSGARRRASARDNGEMTNAIDDNRWDAVAGRQRDARFVFAVRTTNIYCRSGCPSRLPSRRNVLAFDDAAAARRAGFRACKRCAPDDVAADADRVRLIQRACTLLDTDAAPALADVARSIGLSRFHFQRVFRDVVGITPGEYRRARRQERLAARLASGAPVTEALQDAGFGSPSRAYEEDTVGMLPSRYRTGGNGERIAYATATSALGVVLVAATPRGVCAIELGDDEAAVVDALAQRFPHAERVAEPGALREALVAVLRYVEAPRDGLVLSLDVRGTAFQRRVWRALRALQIGETTTYSALAAALGSPRAARAVAAACAANPLALAIPCHRVVRSDGDLAGYRWGVARKRALLARERRPDEREDDGDRPDARRIRLG